MNATSIKIETTSDSNFQQVCRLCLSHELLEDIFDHKDLNLWISAHLSIMVTENDNLSRYICFLCRTRVNEFREFQLLCLEVQDVLENQSIPVIKEELMDETEEAEPTLECNTGQDIIAEENLPAAENENRAPKPIFRAVSKQNRTHSNDRKKKHKRQCYQEQSIVAETNNLQSTIPAAENGIRTPKPTFRLVSQQRTAHCNDAKRKCSMCGEMVHMSALDGHQNMHKGLQPYKCLYGCKNMSFHSHQAQSNHHRTSHSEPRHYTCDVCDKLFQNKLKLLKHKKVAHSSDTKACSICDKTFPSTYALLNHMKSHDRDKSQKKESKQDFLKPSESVETDGLPLTECVKESTIQESRDCNALKQSESSPISEHHINCLICGEQVKQVDMEGHQNQHIDIRPYNCERGCEGISFSCQNMREDHYRSVHDVQHVCDICHTLCRSKVSLWIHKRDMHAGEKIKCCLCNELFSSSTHVKEHMKKKHL